MPDASGVPCGNPHSLRRARRFSLLDKARLHGLSMVATQMQEQLQDQLIALQETLSRVPACLKSPATAIPSLAALLAELPRP